MLGSRKLTIRFIDCKHLILFTHYKYNIEYNNIILKGPFRSLKVKLQHVLALRNKIKLFHAGLCMSVCLSLVITRILSKNIQGNTWKYLFLISLFK